MIITVKFSVALRNDLDVIYPVSLGYRLSLLQQPKFLRNFFQPKLPVTDDPEIDGQNQL